MDANELRAMCELLKRNELIGVPRVVVEALLSRLDAEDAMRTHRIQLEPLGKTEWRAWCLHACEIRDDPVEAVLAVAACVAKIKEQTKEDDDETA